MVFLSSMLYGFKNQEKSMTKMSSLIAQADQFLIDRDWWQFHNPKNDTTNMLVEACELAANFIYHEHVDASIRTEVAHEMADTFFATLISIKAYDIDISHVINNMSPQGTLAQDPTFAELTQFVVQHKKDLDLAELNSPRQAAIALIAEIGQLTDIFIWYTGAESTERTKAKSPAIAVHIGKIVARLIAFADMAGFDLVAEFEQKMKKNAEKYPATLAKGKQYVGIKDAYRKR